MALTYQSKWSDLSRRERILIAIAACVGLGYLTYSFVLEPNYKKYHALQERVPQKTQTYAWMKLEAQKIQPFLKRSKETPNTPMNDMSLVAALEASMKRKGLSDAIKRIHPQSEEEVRVWFANISFNQWVGWLDELRHRNIEAISTRVERAGNGLTNIQITLRNGAIGSDGDL